MKIRKDIRNMLCVAHDVSTLEEVRHFSELLGPYAAISKLGLELFSTPFAFPAVDLILAQKRKVFVDLKIHDVPEVTRKTVCNLAKRGVHMTTVRLGDAQDEERLQAAVENKGSMKILVVTELTSVPRKKDEGTPVPTKVLKRAILARKKGADGIICSAEDLAMLYRVNADFSHMLKVTPGIRPASSPADDQKSIMTPRQAVEISKQDAKMRILVIGRPWTDDRYNNGDPVGAAQLTHQEIADAL